LRRNLLHIDLSVVPTKIYNPLQVIGFKGAFWFEVVLSNNQIGSGWIPWNSLFFTWVRNNRLHRWYFPSYGSCWCKFSYFNFSNIFSRYRY